MIKTLIKNNGRGEAVIIRTTGIGNPRDEETAPFDIQFKTLGGEVKHCVLTYKEVKTLAQDLRTALHEADAEYREEQEEDARTVSDLTTDIMRGFFGC